MILSDAMGNLRVFQNRAVALGMLQSQRKYMPVPFGEASLRRALANFCEHYHTERPHQGKENAIQFPSPDENCARDAPIHCRERLGGLLKYYYPEAG